MTMENPPLYLLLRIGVFQCPVSFQGCNIAIVWSCWELTLQAISSSQNHSASLKYHHALPSGWAMPMPLRGALRPLCSCWLAFLLSLFLHTFLCHPWLAKKCAFWVLVPLTRIQLRHAGWLRRQGLTSMSQNLLQIDNCCFPWQGFFLCATLMTAIPCLVATDEVQLTPWWWRFPLGKYCSLRGQTWKNK